MNALLIMPLALPAYLFQLAAISAFLKTKGHRVRYQKLVIDGDINESQLEKIKKTVLEFRPDLVGFSSYEMSFEWVGRIADYIKQVAPETPIIAGGYYPTLSPADALKHPSIDMICRGEGEFALEELLDSMKEGRKRTDIKNLWFKDGAKIIENPMRELISDLDALPFVDRELFSSPERKRGALEVMVSRGCSFDCTNCSNHALKKLYFGKGPYVRYRSVDNVLSEINYWRDKENFSVVQFEDDMFTLNVPWLREFCAKYKSDVGLPFFCNIRPEAGTREILTLLKDAGCVQVAIGLESGDAQIRQKVLARNIPDKVIISAFKNAKELGLRRKSFNMVGLPHETPGSLFKTIWMNLKLAPEAVQTTVYYPFRGTVLGDECYAEGWVDLGRKKKLKLYANDSILKLPGLPAWLIRAAKWLNSATVLRSGNFSVFKDGLNLIFKPLRKAHVVCQ